MGLENRPRLAADPNPATQQQLQQQPIRQSLTKAEILRQKWAEERGNRLTTVRVLLKYLGT